MTDLHILHPYGWFPTLSHSPEPRLATHRVHESKGTEDLVKGFLSQLPNLSRVGIGRNLVWERQTRWKEGNTDELLVQRLHRAGVPSFYDAGSLPNQGEHDEYPAIRDVVKLLEEL